MIPDDRGLRRLDSAVAEERVGMFPANATPVSANQVRHTSANARGNKSTDISPGGYAATSRNGIIYGRSLAWQQFGNVWNRCV